MEPERGTTTKVSRTEATFGRNGVSGAVEERPLIALFLPSLVSGGAERVTLHIAEGLVRQGIDVDLVLAKATGAYLSQVPEGVNLVDLGAKRVLLSLTKLVKYLRDRRPAVLLSALAHTNLVALWAKALSGTETRVVVAVHSTLSLSTRYSPRRRDRLVPWLTHMFYRQASHVVAVSHGSADDLVRLTRIDPKLVDVIPNPVITDRLFEKSRQPVDLDWFSRDERRPILITVGRLTAAKNYPLLLKAFWKLRESLDANLIILGDGEERSRLEKIVEDLDLADHVHMPGYVDNPWAYMSKSDVFVLSSKWEGLPTVLVEALALGLRVVSTDCEFGPRELLRDGELGFLVPVDDADKLAAGVQKALDAEPPVLDRADLEEFRLDSAVRRYKELLINGSK
ncbi:MAG: glycosyltransferase [Candidatus Latescibacterota bacterium]